ncbi:class I SAM-dependent methyltransferase [Streptomyces fulvoviolaceus]|uniref:class I SAM-dependent methyltransferase n=1 Tax=Streptomyces fulvoviolaceus TaxID=285535 RepID=UPI0021BE912F|nr:class I SAM-dependent methyltransferase [Streptomyces fulvoviolaceus]MCT9076530.1 class I SAM-dependent methyltransferase [Streptomyces fulvoviolaceus]
MPGTLPLPFNAHTGRALGPVLDLPAGAAVLDAGCGRGAVARWLAGRGYRVLGIDVELPDEDATAGEADGLELRRADLLELPGADGRFDAVLLFGVLHYAGHPDRVREMLRTVDRLAAPEAPLALNWICDEIPLDHEDAYLPPRALVLNTLRLLGRHPVDVWDRDVRHAHGGSPVHEHRIVYGVWSR